MLIQDKIMDLAYHGEPVTALQCCGVLQHCSWDDPFKTCLYHFPWSTNSFFVDHIQEIAQDFLQDTHLQVTVELISWSPSELIATRMLYCLSYIAT